MTTKKKRASFSSSAIALSAIKETMENDADVAPSGKHAEHVPVNQPKEKQKDLPPRVTPVTTPPVPVATETDMEAALESEDNEDSALKKKNVIVYRAGMVFVVLIILITVGLYGTSLSMTREKPVVVSKQDPTPTPSPSFDPKTIRIEVLNGSGVAGRAAKGAAALKDKGYEVVGTGNAKKTDSTVLLVSASVGPVTLASFLSDMNALFGVSSSSGTLADSTATARLIIGVK